MRMQKMRRKGYMRTIEAFIAFFITFLFVVFIAYKGIGTKAVKEDMDVLAALEQRDDFRNCIYTGNASCAEEIVDPFMPGAYEYRISIDAPTPFKGAKDIYTETLFIASNQTSQYHIVYLYYWPISG